MKKLFFLLFLSGLALSSPSQIVTTDQGGGMRINPGDGTILTKFSKFDEEGPMSIPLSNCKVNITTKDHTVYNNFNGRLDLRLHKLIYTVDETDLICNLPVEEIKFENCEERLTKAPFRNGFPAVDKQTPEHFYQVLATGSKATFLKFYGLVWQDKTPFNGTNITREYEEVISYYLLSNNTMQKLTKKNGNLLSLIQIPDTYLKQNKPNLSKEEDTIKLISFFNSL